MTITLLETNNSGEVVECGQLDGSHFESRLVKKAWPDVIFVNPTPTAEESEILNNIRFKNGSQFFALEDFDAQSARYMRVGGIVI